MAGPGASELTPEDFRPTVKTNAEKIIGAIDAGYAWPVASVASDAATNVTCPGDDTITTIATLSVVKTQADTAIQLSGYISCLNTGDASGQLELYFFRDAPGAPEQLAVAAQFVSASGVRATLSIPDVTVLDGEAAGTYTLSIRFNSPTRAFSIVPATNDFAAFSLSAQETSVA